MCQNYRSLKWPEPGSRCQPSHHQVQLQVRAVRQRVLVFHILHTYLFFFPGRKTLLGREVIITLSGKTKDPFFLFLNRERQKKQRKLPNYFIHTRAEYEFFFSSIAWLFFFLQRETLRWRSRHNNWRQLVSHISRHDIVPIAMGARPEDYLRSSPDHSYIHVDDFDSPKELADHLRRLDQDDKLYNEYFKWKVRAKI